MFSANSVPINTTFLILIFTSISFVGYTQSDFRDGYYITLQNDTVHGLIDYRGDIRSSRVCNYKKDNASKSIEFSPDEIQAYRFTDSKYYISKKINTGKEEKVVFVEFLVDGISNLYFYKDVDSGIYLIEDDKGELLKLENELDTINVEGKGEVLRNSYRHIGLLLT